MKKILLTNTYYRENIYGHRKRLEWIIGHLDPASTILDFGCGTGYMITLPLAKRGYNVYGFDLDEKSITYGKEIFVERKLDPERLQTVDITKSNLQPDVIIASEVLEHIPDEQLHSIIETLFDKLKIGGKLLVTVPNGYGWFEFENFLWLSGHLVKVFGNPQVLRFINKIKILILRKQFIEKHPSSLSDSPHFQRFTYSDILSLLMQHKFIVYEKRGSTLIAGPLSNMLFTGFEKITGINCRLGDMFSKYASGYYIACSKQQL